MDTIAAMELRHLADRAENDHWTIGPMTLRQAAHTIDMLRAERNKANLDAAELRYELAKPTLLNLMPREEAEAKAKAGREQFERLAEERNRQLLELERAHEALQRDYNALAEEREAAAELHTYHRPGTVALDVPPGSTITITLPQ